MKAWGRKALQYLCKDFPPLPPRRLRGRPKGKATRPYGSVRKERLALHAQLMLERFGPVEEYEAEVRKDCKIKGKR